MDATSPTYGQGDRYRWAWKLIDFGNGTFQGAAHGLARLLAHDLLPEYLPASSVMNRIDTMFHGAESLRRANGSMEEAFPYESSFCVTALVAYDLLTAIELLDTRIEPKQRLRYLSVVQPMIAFLHCADETHAFISNHLATAAAALYKWSALTGKDGGKRGKEILNRILKKQSKEGWFREYEGADPGYQTLCTYYLADLHRLRPDLHLHEPLSKSIHFLWYFAHPDGSFGGYYGSRNTRFYYPAGVEYLADEIPEAAVLSAFMRNSILHQTTVTLDTIDEPNLVPMFNAYCWAAELFESRNEYDAVPLQPLSDEGVKVSSNDIPPLRGVGGCQTWANNSIPQLPCLDNKSWRKMLTDAGLVVEKRPEYYCVISTHKGGVCYYFRGGETRIDTGVAACDKNGRFYSTQAYQTDNEVIWKKDTVSIISRFVRMRKQLPTPIQFIILRILNVTLMRSRTVGNWVKNALVQLLITGNKQVFARNCRTIVFSEKCEIRDEWLDNHVGLQRVEMNSPFSAIHMASQGYWQRQDDSR